MTGGGFDREKIVGCFGEPHTIIDPGVSIKPYPCGVLTHPSMDAMLALVKEHDLKPEDSAVAGLDHIKNMEEFITLLNPRH